MATSTPCLDKVDSFADVFHQRAVIHWVNQASWIAGGQTAHRAAILRARADSEPNSPGRAVVGALPGTSRHVGLLCVEGGQHFPFFALGHIEMIKAAAELRGNLVEHFGCDV